MELPNAVERHRFQVRNLLLHGGNVAHVPARVRTDMLLQSFDRQRTGFFEIALDGRDALLPGLFEIGFTEGRLAQYFRRQPGSAARQILSRSLDAGRRMLEAELVVTGPPRPSAVRCRNLLIAIRALSRSISGSKSAAAILL